MALMRVYCGLATTGSPARSAGDSDWLTAAVVDDAGRLLDLCDITDDACGYAELGGLLAERSGGTTGVAVAADTDEHEVTLLLLAAGRPLAIADDETVGDYAERFADDESVDEISAGTAERNAVGLARALQAGALAAASRGAPRELMALGPVLAAHAAVAVSRHGSAVALREVLRELYPAALRAYPDPAAPIPLAILDALPEPGLLGISNRGRDAAVAADLSMAGIADTATITDAITALRIAASETPRRTGIGKGPTSAVAETIRQAVAAVRACDAAVASLVGLLAAQDLAPRRHEPTRLRAVSPRAIEAARPEPAQHDESPYAPARHAASRSDATRPGQVRPEPVRPEPGREPARPEPARTDAARFDPVWQESARYDAARASRRARSAGTASGPPARPTTMPPTLSYPASEPAAQPGIRPLAAQTPSAGPEAATRPNRTPPQRSARSSTRSAPARVDDDFSTPLAPGPVPTADVDLFSMPETPAGSTGGALRSSWHDEAEPAEPSSHNASPTTGPSFASNESPGTALVPSDYDRIYREQARPTVAYPAAGRPAAPVSNYPVEPRYLGDAGAFPSDTATGGYDADPPRMNGHRAAEDRPRAAAATIRGWRRANRRTAVRRRLRRPAPPVVPGTADRSRPIHRRTKLRGPAAIRLRAFRRRDHGATGRSPRRIRPTTWRERVPTRARPRPCGVRRSLPRTTPSTRTTPGSRGSGTVASRRRGRPAISRRRPSRRHCGSSIRPCCAWSAATTNAISRRAGRSYADDHLPPMPPVPVDDEPDDDLLIFAQARSAWFVDPHDGEEATPSWSAAADQGWSAAERAAHPSIDGETEVGLPRRVPKANLVPGSPLPPVADDGLPIVRDPAAMAAHTTGYFRGSRRGEEVRGYAVGGRPGRESGEGWDFSRDGWETDREPEYRSAAHR